MQENLTDGQIDWNDRATMQYLFRRFYLPLRSFAYQHVKDDSITDDFVQNAFLNLWERRMNFNAVLAVKSFLYLNVRNACLNYLKREQVRVRHEGHVIRMLTEEDCADIALEEEVNPIEPNEVSPSTKVESSLLEEKKDCELPCEEVKKKKESESKSSIVITSCWEQNVDSPYVW